MRCKCTYGSWEAVVSYEGVENWNPREPVHWNKSVTLPLSVLCSSLHFTGHVDPNRRIVKTVTVLFLNQVQLSRRGRSRRQGIYVLVLYLRITIYDDLKPDHTIRRFWLTLLVRLYINVPGDVTRSISVSLCINNFLVLL